MPQAIAFLVAFTASNAAASIGLGVAAQATVAWAAAALTPIALVAPLATASESLQDFSRRNRLA